MIDVTRGIAITLVVVAHYHPADSPRWWSNFNHLISQVDVRVFFFVAGYVWHVRPGEPYLVYLGRKARRLLIPYVVVAALFLGIKIVPSLFMKLVNPVSLASVANILIDPLHSYMPLLWFLYSLFCIQAVFPAIHRLGPRAFPGLIVVTALLGIPTSFLCLGPTWGSLPYFLAGAYVAQALHLNLDQHVPKHAWVWVVLCAALFLGIWTGWTPAGVMGRRVNETLLGTTGVAATVLICQSLATRSIRGVALLAYLGTSSLTIYLFHTLFESTARVVLNRLPVVSDLPFVVKAIPAIVAGLYLPVLARGLVLRLKASWLRGKTVAIASRPS